MWITETGLLSLDRHKPVAVAEWVARLTDMWEVSRSNLPLLKHACGEAMLATKRSAGVAPEVNLRECITCTPPPSANKAALALKPRGEVTRSPKQGYQWPHKKDLCPPKI